MKLRDRSIELMKELIKAYFVDRNIDFIIRSLDQEVIWMGNGANEQYQGYDKIVELLRNEQQNHNFHYEIIKDDYHTVMLQDSLCQVFCVVEITDQKKANTVNMQLRITATFAKDEGMLKIKTMHMAIASNPKRNHQSFMEAFHNESRDALQTIIDEKNRQLIETGNDLKRLTENLPGGIVRCRFDEDLTIVQVSDGFLSMFGYTREEIEKDLHNSFKRMIEPHDFPQTLIDVKRQMELGNTKTLEYRIRCKDGHSMWVLDKGTLIYTADENVPCFHCILVDITQGKIAREELRLALEKHRIITNQTNDIIFEWNVETDQFTFSNNWEKKFGYTPMRINNTNMILNESHLNREDSYRLNESLREIAAGVPYAVCDVRIRDQGGEYIWCQARMTAQFNEQGKAISAVGVLIDIDNMKTQSERLMMKAQQDALTKLFNKEASRNHIEDALHDDRHKHALMVIDVDDFKLVNDTMGHLFGDAFLSEVACQLKQIFNEEDIVGRIGGDEFIAFLSNVSTREQVEEKAKAVIAVFDGLKVDEEMKLKVSCSIGIALFPDCGKSFNDLYHRADLALYEAKRNGKNTYIMGDDEKFNANMLPTYANLSAINSKIDSEDETSSYVLDNLIEHIFRILYQSMDVNEAISSILKIVGEYFDVSRAYIFENTEDNLFCCNTFEWCNQEIEPEIHHLQKVSYEKDLGGTYLNNFNENDIFYCRNIEDLPKDQYEILAPQNIRSILQCGIRDNGVFKGYVGFDECRKNRFWTQEQINTLTFIAELLSIFLMKDRAKQNLENIAAGLQSVLDNQNAWIYVIEPETFRLLYINKKTKELVPGVKLGATCHKSFFNRDSQCESCPLMGIGSDQKNNTIEVYNPVLDIWSLADASQILWEGRPAMLLSCHDMTEYRKRKIAEKNG